MTVDDTLAPPVAELEDFFRFDGDDVALPLCLDCDRYHWYPLGRCPHCYSDRLVWMAVDGRATVFSATTVRYAFTERTRGTTPYGLALVAFDVAPEIRMVCRAVGPTPAVGDAVTVRVERDPADGGTGIIWCSPADEQDPA